MRTQLPQKPHPAFKLEVLLRSGSQWTSLRSPFHARTDQPVLHHPGILQECPDEFQQPLVLDPFGDLTHQFVMRNSIEKFLKIKINAPAVSRSNPGTRMEQIRFQLSRGLSYWC
jgi:hypothetical protein